MNQEHLEAIMRQPFYRTNTPENLAAQNRLLALPHVGGSKLEVDNLPKLDLQRLSQEAVLALYLNKIALDKCWYLDREYLHIDNRPVRKKQITLPAAEGHAHHWKKKLTIYPNRARDFYHYKRDPFIGDDYAVLFAFDIHHWCRDKRCVNPHHLLALRPEDHRAVHAGVGDEETYQQAYAAERKEKVKAQHEIWAAEEKKERESKLWFRIKRWWKEAA